MHRLISLVAVTFIYMITLLLLSQTKDSYIVFNLCVVAVIVSGYFSDAFNTLLITLFCCALTSTLIPAGVLAHNVLQAIFLFIACAFLSITINKIYNKIKNYRINDIKLSSEKLTISKLEAGHLNDSKIYLENKVSKISSLYYSVKNMGSCFGFEDVLGILRDTLTESFKFKNCHLITLYYANEAVKIDKIYKIAKDKIEQTQSHSHEEGLVNFMLRKKQPLVIDTKKGKTDAEEFILPAGLTTFIAAPIIAAEKTNAILAAQDLELEQADQFMVVANQFSITLERIRLYELVQELATTDGLTDVFVRRHMLERLNEELNRADRFNTRVSLLMIDMDNFKDYNDRHGHIEGDLLLKKTAAILKSAIREIDIIGRYGGEEFCVILPDTDSKRAGLVANRLIENVRRLDATLSVGIATYPEDAKNYANLIEKADKMLYKAKQAGKNRVCVYAQ